MGELEHYGVPGMRWGKKRTRKDPPKNTGGGSGIQGPPFPEIGKPSAPGQSLRETKVGDTVKWMQQNPLALSKYWDSNSRTLQVPKLSVSAVQKAATNLRKTLRSVGGHTVNTVKKSSAVAKGENKIAKLFKRKNSK